MNHLFSNILHSTRWSIVVGLVAIVATQAEAASPSEVFEAHVKAYKNLEFFSGAELSVSLPGKAIETFYSGRVSHDGNSPPVSASTLFQIGSITKSFTGAMMLQLEKEGRLALSDDLASWLPVYHKWGGIDITRMLNMTSGLPNYSDTPLWNTLVGRNPARVFTERQLIGYVYPNEGFWPPLRSTVDNPDYFYTNTGYILSGLIAEKADRDGRTVKEQFETRFFKTAKLENTYYPVPVAERAVRENLASGYNYNQYDNPEIVGMDMRNNNLSWAGAAGGIVSTSEDVIKWVRALFTGNTILDGAQRKKLMRLVSTRTGEPIARTSESDPGGFGLGVAQVWQRGLGPFWFYEGITLGFRATYMYMPCNGVVISNIFNSVPNHHNDHVGKLMNGVYAAVLEQNPGLKCR